MQGNPNPSPATRFKPGNCPNPLGRAGKPGRLQTPSRCMVPKVRPIDEVRGDPACFKGTPAEFLESVMRDEQQDLQTRLACASSLLKYDAALVRPSGPDAEAVWRLFEQRLSRLLAAPQPRLVEGELVPEPAAPEGGGEGSATSK
jgi:hypothetical protein